MKIYCITHKPIDGIKSLNLIPFGVGKAKFPNDYIIENSGDNIAHKNYNYSETSFHYWYWKNILNQKKIMIGLECVNTEGILSKLNIRI